MFRVARRRGGERLLDSDSLDLRPFVPPLVAQGWAATPGRPWLSRFPGAVIFADLSGFTAMAEQLSLKGAEGAEELARSLDSFFEALFEVIAGDAPGRRTCSLRAGSWTESSDRAKRPPWPLALIAAHRASSNSHLYALITSSSILLAS